MIWRGVKIVFAIVLLGFSLWALLLPPFFPSSSDAVVNTRKIFIEAPRDGVVSTLAVTPRTHVLEGDILTGISLDLTEIRRELLELEFAHERLTTQMQSSEERLKYLQNSLQRNKQDLQERQERTTASLKTEQEGLEESIVILREEQRLLKEDEQRIKSLLDKGIVTKARWGDVNQRVVEGARRLQDAINRRNRIAKELDLATDGFFLSDPDTASYSSPSENVVSTLNYEVRTVEAELLEHRLKLKETTRLIENLKTFLKSSQIQEITSPVDGLIWTIQSVEGQTISSGQSLMEIANRQSVFVEAFFHRFYEDSISPGDYAFISLNGRKEQLRGRVIDVQLQEHGSPNLNIINSVAPDSSMLRVILHVDGEKLDPEMVGRLGKAVITSSRPGWINRSLVWISLRLRSS